MAGETLRQYDAELCDYIRANIEDACKDAELRAWLECGLNESLLKILGLASNEGEVPGEEVLLSMEDLMELEDAIRQSTSKQNWSPYPPLHRRKVHFVPEIRELVTPSDAEDWSRDSSKFASQLEEPDVSLADGVQTIRLWLISLRRYLKAMERNNLDPRLSPESPRPAQPSGIKNATQESAGRLKVTCNEDIYLDVMRKEIAKHEKGDQMSMNELVKAAGINRQAGLAALRQLKTLGEYTGVRQPAARRRSAD